jgi:hypothetical protein
MKHIKIFEQFLNEGHNLTINVPDSSTKEEAIKELDSKIEYSKEIDGIFRKFRGVKWIGNVTEDTLADEASRNEDYFVVLGEVNGKLRYAYATRS